MIITKLREVGSKDGKSLVPPFPARIVKSNHMDKNTAFELEIDQHTGKVTLHRILGLSERHSVSAGKSVEASVQQTPAGNQ
jgi:hypothetical protein